MKTLIYYFTGTGNSYSVARQLAEELGSTTLIRITSKLPEENTITGYKRLEIVVPAYMGSIPEMAQHFLEGLRVDAKTYVFDVVTCAGNEGASHDAVRKILDQRGITVSAGFTFNLPANNQTLYTPADELKQAVLVRQTKVDVREAAQVIREEGTTKFTPSPMMKYVSKMAGRIMIPKDSDKNFSVTDNCVGCGICAEVCPAGNIVIKDGKPEWQHHCERCTACMQLCPKRAIEFGSRTKNWGRYHHPDVSVNDLIIPDKDSFVVNSVNKISGEDKNEHERNV